MQLFKFPNDCDLGEMAIPYSCSQDKCSCYEERDKYQTCHYLNCHWN